MAKSEMFMLAVPPLILAAIWLVTKLHNGR